MYEAAFELLEYLTNHFLNHLDSHRLDAGSPWQKRNLANASNELGNLLRKAQDEHKGGG